MNLNTLYRNNWVFLVCLTVCISACEKEEDFLVDRVVAPVLVTVAGTSFEAEENVQVLASFYELDKSGLLDHTIGIDSIPISNLLIQVRVAGSGLLTELTTGADGAALLSTTWAEMGFPEPKAGNTVNLEWSGSYKGQPFTKLSRVQVK